MLNNLRGMFAFAIWDARDRSLFMARDRLGKKPLYYGWVGSTFLFASELKALRAFPGFEGEIELSLVNAPEGYRLDGARIPAGVNSSSPSMVISILSKLSNNGILFSLANRSVFKDVGTAPRIANLP